MAKKVWITYSWKDNAAKDVDFIAQELEQEGLEVHLDRWNLEAGKRLWEQIEHHIQDPGKSDAWLIVATQNSISTEPCKEEFAYALDRALSARTNVFPVIALFTSTVDVSLLPAGLRTRLCVSMTDPDWKERIKAAVEGRAPSIRRATIDPYVLTVHRKFWKDEDAIEVRPRAGVWSPFVAAVPVAEKEEIKPSIIHGPVGQLPGAQTVHDAREQTVGDLYVMSASDEATPTRSYYIFCKRLPSVLIFGATRGPQFKVLLPA
jgi:hypothetical protein